MYKPKNDPFLTTTTTTNKIKQRVKLSVCKVMWNMKHKIMSFVDIEK